MAADLPPQPVTVFLVNIPICLVALVAGFFLLPKSREPEETSLDPVGAVLSIVGIVGAFIGGFVLRMIGGGGSTLNQSDFSIPSLIAAFVGACILLAIVNLVRRGSVR